MVNLKRIYEPASPQDGYRILVDRLWPRGVSKERAAVDLWLKDIAPSPALRTWFGHDPKKWRAFQVKYRAELRENTAAVATLTKVVGSKNRVTLLSGAKDTDHTHARVLQTILARSQ